MVGHTGRFSVVWQVLKDRWDSEPEVWMVQAWGRRGFARFGR
jgi:hypothetical protein